MNILLVEDNLADALLVEEAFREAQFDCVLAVVRDGEQALQAIELLGKDPNTPCPDLILLDLNLPRVGGNEVLARLRSIPRCAGVKVLIVSSSDAPADREKAMSLGASDYFRKPSSLDGFMKLGARVRALFDAP